MGSAFFALPEHRSIRLPIGLDGLSCTAFLPDSTLCRIILGSSRGRIRSYDFSGYKTDCVYQRRWHKSVRCLDFLPCTRTLVTASSESGLKMHDIESGKRVWMCLCAHDRTPICSLLTTSPTQCVTGDEDGIVKVWDIRIPGAAVQTILPLSDEDVEDNFGAVNDMAFGDRRNILLAALDNGSLAVLNIRKTRVEVMSDTLGYSARSVVVLKNSRNVVVGTEEGVLCVFNWDEFEIVADRFALFPSNTTKDGVSVEKLVKLSEDAVAVATDDGKISVATVRPNGLLGVIGHHSDTERSSGDCLNLAFSREHCALGSVCPDSSIARLWPMGKWMDKVNKDLVKSTKRKRLGKSNEAIERKKYLSGLLPEICKQITPDTEDGDSDDSSD